MHKEKIILFREFVGKAEELIQLERPRHTTNYVINTKLWKELITYLVA
jgi:hypothetical protein